MVSARRAARRGVVATAISLAAGMVGGCELRETAAPALEPRAVVHAVLNPTATEQIVRVERTLRSAATCCGGNGVPFDAITDARVVVYGPREDSATAVPTTDPGAYRLRTVTITDGSAGSAPPDVLRLRPGERYRLRVETALGVVLGETVIPLGAPVASARRTFNVDHDTLRFVAPAGARAAGYLLRHVTATTGRERYTATLAETLIRPPGRGANDPPWAFEFAREGVRPGHAQTFVIVAVDSNYFRYYVAGFDPFGDDTRGNTLTGGVGLFGSVAPFVASTLDLVADIDTPIEGTWTADRNSLTLPLTITLYSSPLFPAEAPAGRAYVSGLGRTFFGRTLEATGSMNGSGIALGFIDPSGGSPQVGATGLLGTSTLVLTDGGTGERVTYRKR